MASHSPFPIGQDSVWVWLHPLAIGVKRSSLPKVITVLRGCVKQGRVLRVRVAGVIPYPAWPNGQLTLPNSPKCDSGVRR